MNWKQLIDQHWGDIFALLLILLSIPCYLLVNPEFGALIAGAGIGVIRGDRKQRKADGPESGAG